jgi:hypothetical protein
MRKAHRLLLARGGELLGGEVAYGLRDRVAHAVLTAVHAPHQRRVDQAAQRFERVDGPAVGRDLRHHLDRLQRRRAGERRETRQQRLLAGVQQVVGPVQGGAQAAMALGEVSRAACEHPERSVESGEQLTRRKRGHARCGELDGQRHPVDPGTDRLDVGAMRARVELGRDRTRAQIEERYGALPRERSEGQQPLTGDAQGQLAGHQRARPRRLLEQLLDGGGGFDELFEVVEQEERRARTQPRGDDLAERAAVALVDPQRRRDRRKQPARVSHARE